MIIYIFNNPFPDNSGFGNRCKQQIDILSQKEDVAIICRGINKDRSQDSYICGNSIIPIHRFLLDIPLMDRPKKYVQGLCEIYRNIGLMIKLFLVISKVVVAQPKDRIVKIHAVSSPLTVPLVAYIVSLFYGTKLQVLEFHDLEPELAMHIKKLSRKSLIVRIEFLLEKFLCNKYENIIVTSQGQADRISIRTEISKSRIHIIPNISFSYSRRKINNNIVRKKYGLSVTDYVIGYISNFSFDYTITGAKKLIELLSKLQNLSNVKLMFVGDGIGLSILQEAAIISKTQNRFIFTKRVTDTSEILSILDAAIIPWEQDVMTETILPTKLFEYLEAGKCIIAPKFGEFKRVLQNKKNALLFDSIQEIPVILQNLYKDKKLQHNLSRNALLLYNQFSSRKVYEKSLKLAHNLI